MRNLRAVQAVFVGSAVGALALGGCGRTSDVTFGTTRTTGGVLLSERTLAPPPNGPHDSSGPEIAGEFRRVPNSASAAHAVEVSGPGTLVDETVRDEDGNVRRPAYEPNGGMVSDVGVPYPLPDLPMGVPSARPPRATQPSQSSPPFVETSFGPDKPSPGFVESSFGPDKPSPGFAESSFGSTSGRQ